MSSLSTCALVGSPAVASFASRGVSWIPTVRGSSMAFLTRPTLRSVGRRTDFRVLGNARISCSLDESNEIENKNGNPKNLADAIRDSSNLLSASSSFLLLQSALSCAPAFASGYTDEEYVQGILTLVAFAGFYFFVAPPTIFWYLKERTFKSKMLETVFQFLLVFLFFPGLLVWAPFINFRPLPSDPSKMPKI